MKRIALLIEVEVSDHEDSMLGPRDVGGLSVHILRESGAWKYHEVRLVTAWRSGDPIPDPVRDAIDATGGHE